MLDWVNASPSFTAGDTDHTFVNVDGSGIDVRVLVTGDTEFNGTSPSVTTLGAPVNDPAYQVFMDWDSNADDIRIRMLFFETGTTTRAEVRNLTINIYDIDRRGESSTGGVEDDSPSPDYVYQDEISRIRGRTITSGFGAANIFPDLEAGGSGTGQITISGEGTASSSVLGQGYYDNENPNARLDVVFNDDVAGVDFLYGNGPDGPTNPSPQTILFGGFSFNAIPEPGAWIGCLSFLLLFLFSESRRRTTS